MSDENGMRERVLEEGAILNWDRLQGRVFPIRIYWRMLLGITHVWETEKETWAGGK